MKKLFILLLRQYPLIISNSSLYELLNQSDTKILFNLGILKETHSVATLPCSECGYGNDILFDENNRPYYICSCENGGRVLLHESDIKRYEVKVENLINLLLNKEEDKTIQLKSDKLWSTGEKIVGKQKFSLYFYIGKDTDIIDKLNILSPYSIILYFDKTVITDNSIVFVSLFDVFQIDMTVNFLTIEDFISKNLRFVEFTDKGNVQIYKKEIATIPHPTPQYFFFEYLYNHFGEWKTNEEIYGYVSIQMAKANKQPNWKSDYGDGFSKAMLDKIKKSSTNKKLIKTIFGNNHKKGYCVKNPS